MIPAAACRISFVTRPAFGAFSSSGPSATVRASGATSFVRWSESKIAATLAAVGGRVCASSGRVNITFRPRSSRHARAARATSSEVIVGRIRRASDSSCAGSASAPSPVRKCSV
jgi:hypothetical protein